MSKRLMVVLALALIVGLTFSAAYAEVQNVKVSGDIIASGVARSHFNLQSVPADKSILKQNFLMTQVRLRVDADLTDNVSATVRLINERIWNGQNDTASTSAASNNTEIDLDLAYVTLKEFLYSPLTLTIGRQEIKFGNSFVIGNAKVIGSSSSIPTDLTERKAFDAIRATLNYDPLVVDLVYAQVKQNNSVDRNTTSLTGINAAYALNKKTDLSVYYWLKKDNNLLVATGSRTDQLSTIGALISMLPIENLATSLEAAYQFGRNTQSATGAKRHDAWALQAMADYTFAKVKTTPKIGASYTYLSGDQTGGTRNSGWDPLFYDQKLNNIVYTLLPFSNMNAFNLRGSMKPVEDVTISAVYGYYNVAQKNAAGFTVPNTYDDNGATYYTGTYSGKTHLGEALDLTAIYDYTEDVQFGITGGVFRAGPALLDNGKAAQQVIGSMKVVF